MTKRRIGIVLATAGILCWCSALAPATVFNVKEHGAKGDTRIVHDAFMACGSNKLCSAVARFTSADVGQAVYVVGAGLKGAPLSSTITAINSPQQAELATTASTAVQGASLTIGTDDYDAISQTISAAAAAHGGIIYFPSGVYRITRDLEIKSSNIHLEGDGDTSVIYNSHILFHGDNKEKHLAGGWSGTRVITIGTTNHPIANIEIAHLQMMNNGDTWVHSFIGQPLIMTGATTNYITRDFRLHHVTLTTKSYNGYSNGGILEGFAIHHLTVREFPKEAIYLAGYSSNGEITDNQLSTTLNTAGSNIGIACKSMKHVKILRNNISGQFWVGIGLYWHYEDDVLIADNICSFTPHPQAADGIYVDHGTRITVSRNTIENAGVFGITFRGPDTNISDIVITDNIVRNTSRGQAISIMGGNNPSRGPRNVTITGNTLRDNAGGIEAWNLTGQSTISNNLIHSTTNRTGAAFHVQPVVGATIAASGNQVVNYQPGIFRLSSDQPAQK